MFTNYDQLARLKIEEHEEYARKTSLQRHARAARKRSQLAEANGGGIFNSLRRVTTAVSYVVVAASHALRAVAR